MDGLAVFDDVQGAPAGALELVAVQLVAHALQRRARKQQRIAPARARERHQALVGGAESRLPVAIAVAHRTLAQLLKVVAQAHIGLHVRLRARGGSFDGAARAHQIVEAAVGEQADDREDEYDDDQLQQCEAAHAARSRDRARSMAHRGISALLLLLLLRCRFSTCAMKPDRRASTALSRAALTLMSTRRSFSSAVSLMTCS